jgi:hypothetical protein
MGYILRFRCKDTHVRYWEKYVLHRWLTISVPKSIRDIFPAKDAFINGYTSHGVKIIYENAEIGIVDENVIIRQRHTSHYPVRFELTKEREDFIKSHLPAWFGKDIKGRFVTNDRIYSNTNQITYSSEDINKLDEYKEGLYPVKLSKKHSIILWSDGIVTKRGFNNSNFNEIEQIDENLAKYISYRGRIDENELLSQNFISSREIIIEDENRGMESCVEEVKLSENTYYALSVTMYGHEYANTTNTLYRTFEEATDEIKSIHELDEMDF